MSPDIEELLGRQQRSPGLLEGLRNPLAIRFPLLDPDAWLARHLVSVAPFFSLPARVAMATLTLWAVVRASLDASAIATDAASLALEPRAWLGLGVAYVVLKALHELGHAFAARRHGAEVHELGITLLLLLPVPYVDASGAALLADKRKRIEVSAAGVVVECVAAGLALWLWTALEPGFLRSLAAQVFLLGTLSTLLFNGNPLLRYDGYYVLADALEIPNLYERARTHLRSIFERRVLELDDARNAVQVPGEAPWLLAYGVGAFVYRMLLLLTIAWILYRGVPGIGIVLAALWLGFQVLLPLISGVGFLLTDPRLASKRGRVVFGHAGLALLLLVAVTAVPLPHHSVAQGVAWLPDDAHVRAEVDGFVARWLALPGAPVEAGEPVIQLATPLVEARVHALAARHRALKRERAGAALDRLKIARLDGELVTLRAQLAQAERELQRTTVASPGDGLLLSGEGIDLPSRFVRKGDTLGYVVGAERPIVRVAVDQVQLAHIRGGTTAVAVKLGGARVPAERGRIIREVPAATHRLPSASLGTKGGGAFPVAPDDPEGLQSLEPVYWLDVEVERESLPRVGDRAYVRFDHAPSALAPRLFAEVRALFLREIEL